MCEVLIDYPKHLFMSIKPSNGFRKAKKSRQQIVSSEQQEVTMNRRGHQTQSNGVIPPPISLDTHPSRQRGGNKKPVYTSTPDLANLSLSDNSSSESLGAVCPSNQQERRSHHYSSHEDVNSAEDVSKVHPSTRYEWSEAFTTNSTTTTLKPHESSSSVDPSTRYEWSEPMKPSPSSSKTGGVSEGYCRLRIMDEPEKKRSVSCGDYSVLNLDSLSNGRPSSASPNHSSSNTNTHNYFTLEVLDNLPSSPVNHPRSGSSSPQRDQHYSHINTMSTLNTGPVSSNSRSRNNSTSEAVYFTLEETSSSSTGFDSHHQPSSGSGYSYVELDTVDDRSIPHSPTPYIVPCSRNNAPKNKSMSTFRSAGHLTKDSTGNKENTYDSLRHDYRQQHQHQRPASTSTAPRTVRSISQSEYSRTMSPHHHRTPSPSKTHHRRVPGTTARSSSTIQQQSITPPTLPYHKKPGFNRIHSYHGTGGATPPSPRIALTRSHSPKSPLVTTTAATVQHDYDEVEIIEDGDEEGSLTDDDVSLPSPTSPLTPNGLVSGEPQDCPLPSNNNSMVQLIITDEGPLLVPRKRSLTADASSLKQFRNQRQLHSSQSSSRPDSSLAQQQHRAASAFGHK